MGNIGPGDLSKWLGVTEKTIRVWSDKYSAFLSPTAIGGDGRHRAFNEHDQRIVAHVARLRDENMPLDDIQVELARLQDDNWIDLPAMPPQQDASHPLPPVPREAVEEVRVALLKEIALREQTIDRLQDELRLAQSERAESQSALLAAREELGELRGRLAAIDGPTKTQQQLMMRAIVALAIAVAILLAVVVLLALGMPGA